MNIIRDSVYGFAVGDALGVPVEFKSRNELKKFPVIGMSGYGTHQMPKGCWSDDTSMILATMDSIIEKNNIDYEDIMFKFCEWYRYGKYTANGVFFDIGIATSQSLNKYIAGISPIYCGQSDERSNGNGSLMRILPIVLYSYYNNLNDDDITNLINNCSSLTHAHEVSKLGCKIYSDFLILLIKGYSKEDALMGLKKDNYRKFYSDDAIEKYSRIFNSNFSSIKENEIKSNGYIVDTLEASIWCIMNTNDYKTAVLSAVNLGNDTDTVGAITGSIAGVIYGVDSIPEIWLYQLMNNDYIQEKILQFQQSIAVKKKK